MVKRTPKAAAAGGGRKRSHKADDADDSAGFFLLDDDDRKKQPESEDDEEQQETAEQKRIRLARAYLDELRAATVGGDDVGTDEAEDGRPGVTGAAEINDELADRLRTEALEAQGRLHVKLAHRVVLPSQQVSATTEEDPQPSGRGRLYGTGNFCRAHRLSPTALALSSDERTAFTVAKDGTILKWDVETMQRTQLIR
eukprot:GHRR01020662.1.p1 GENE.GHRR01020662.1~~GHRR01020662.1.p1  ORF type:complete len:198 (+),score=62.67 GHRR01020662.1:43-636(+)